MTIKCGLCGKDVVVADGLADGQHVLCPFCGGKFSYEVEDIYGHGAGDVGRKKVVKPLRYMKTEVREKRSKIDSRAEVLARRKTVVGITVACSAVIVIALLSSFAYLNWREEKASADRRVAAEKARRDAIVAERNQRREKLRQYVSEQLNDLKRKKSDVIFEINGVSRTMRDKRDAGEDVSLLKSQKEVLRLKQDAIQGALNVFLSAGMRLDILNSDEIDDAERELVQKMRDLAIALENASKQEMETKQAVEDRIKVQNLPRVHDVGDVSSDDPLVVAGIAVGQFTKLDSKTKKRVVAEVKHDLEMRNRKQMTNESQEVVAGEPENTQSSPPSGDSMETTASNVVTTAAEVRVQKDKKPEQVKKPKLRKCHRCFGKGTVVETVNEKCDDCEGRGYIVKEVTLKDTKHYTDGYWNYKSVGSRTSKNKQYCLRCNHRGKIAVKREKECPTCSGCGFFTKDGVPYKAPVATAVELAAAEEIKEMSQWLIPTAENGGAIWHYIKVEPERSWFKTSYDHSKWFDGRSAFSGKTDRLNTGTEWNSQDIYLRKEFKFNGDPAMIKVAKLRYTIDDILHVWLNGSKITEQSGTDERYREVDVTKEFVRCLRKGENIIAVWAHNVVGRRNADVGLFVIYQGER